MCQTSRNFEASPAPRAVKHDLYGFKFYTLHVLGQPWQMPHFIKPPKTQRLPDIVTIEQAQALFAATRTLSYKVFYFTLCSMGLRLGEGLTLRVDDIDAARHRVHIRDAEGNRDRLVPLPQATLSALRRFWATHRNEAGVDLLEVQKILGHHSIPATARYTHLSSITGEQASAHIDALMARFTLDWAGVR